MLRLYTHSTKELLTLSIGDRIKKARVFRGMTQKELGVAVGFNKRGADVTSDLSIYQKNKDLFYNALEIGRASCRERV